MTGTLINVAAVLIGGFIGLFFGARIPERYKSTVIAGMGLFTALMGVQMFLKTQNPLIVLGALLIGGLLGEWWGIEDMVQNLGRTLEQRFSKEDGDDSGANFIRGFMTASLLFCIGPMAILGSINDGLSGDYSLLAVKSILDGFAAIAFASTLGIGVLFSSIPVFVFQGGISLAAIQLASSFTVAGELEVSSSDPRILELTATGGVLLLGIAISNLLEIKKIRVGNFLPALAIAPLIVWVLGKF